MTSRTTAWLILGALVYVLPAAGQSTFGSITGTATDQSGSVVPGIASARFLWRNRFDHC
jgi:hypothetical protein